MWKGLNVDAMTREQLNSYLQRFHKDLGIRQTDALWALVCLSTDNQKTIDIYLRLTSELVADVGGLDTDDLDIDVKKPWF